MRRVHFCKLGEKGFALIQRTEVMRILVGFRTVKVKGKIFPYSLPSVGPGADPGVQAVSPQVT